MNLLLDLLGYAASFLLPHSAASARAAPLSRSIFDILISWMFRAFIATAVFIVALVLLWTLLKHLFFRQVRNVVRPEYMDLVNRMREWFSIQQIREEPTPAQESRVFTSADKNCPICLLDPAEMPVQTNCGHVFCGNCIIAYWRQGTWGTGGVKCPVCRQTVTLLMRDMRPGVVIPEDADRAADIEQDIRRYNQRFSGEPRSLVEKIRDLPSILDHFWQNFTVVNGLGMLFHGRMFLYVIMFVAYFLMPFDLLPESLLGIFGLVDDAAALGLLVTQLAGLWRTMIVRDQFR